MMVATKIDTKLVTWASELLVGFMKLMVALISTAITTFVMVDIRAAISWRKVFIKISSLNVWQSVLTPVSVKKLRILVSQKQYTKDESVEAWA